MAKTAEKRVLMPARQLVSIMFGLRKVTVLEKCPWEDVRVVGYFFIYAFGSHAAGVRRAWPHRPWVRGSQRERGCRECCWGHAETVLGRGSGCLN